MNQLGDEAAAHVPALTAALAKLQLAAQEQEVRLLRLEGQAAVVVEDSTAAAAGQWAAFVRGHRYRSAVKQLRGGLQQELLEVQATCQEQAAQLLHMQAALDAVTCECSVLTGQLQHASMAHQAELQRLADAQQQKVASLCAQAKQEQHAVQQQLHDAADAAADQAERLVEAAAR